MAKKKSHEPDPKRERREIGTPAGEAPEKGRARHGEQCLTDVCPADNEPDLRREVDPDYIEDDIGLLGEEISTSGGITGTHVKGGVPRGGYTSGGTQPERRETTAEGRVESRRGKTSA